jgi:hypothetical protein
MTDERVSLRLPAQLWEWIDSRAWHENDWEQFRAVELPRATKVCRALLLFYQWMQKVPAYNSRRGAEVTITFETEDQARIFCAMLAKETRRQERHEPPT